MNKRKRAILIIGLVVAFAVSMPIGEFTGTPYVYKNGEKSSIPGYRKEAYYAHLERDFNYKAAAYSFLLIMGAVGIYLVYPDLRSTNEPKEKE